MEEKVNIWSKKAEDLTVGETIKVAGVATVVCTVLPLAVYGAIYGVVMWAEKRKMKKLDKEVENLNKV